MTDAPERIWAFHAPDIEQDNLGCTIVAGEKAMPFSTEYIRVDLSADHIDAQAATIKALVEALERIAHASDVYGVEANAEDQGADTLAYAHKSTCNLARAALAAAKETT